MTHNEFVNLIYPFMDGELDATQHREVEVYLESSQEARDLLNLELRLNQKSQEILRDSSDLVAQGRALARFRAAVEGGLGEEENSHQEKQRAGSTIFSPLFWKVPVAAAVVFMLAWMGGIFETSNSIIRPVEFANNAQERLIDVVQVSERRFRSDLKKNSKKLGCRYMGVQECLSESTEPEFWPPNSSVSSVKRYEKFRKLVSSCMGRKVDLPCLPGQLELVGARTARLEFAGKTLLVPHLILMTKTERISAYVICKSQSKEIAKGLHEIANSNPEKSCLWGCPIKGVMVRKCNDVWLVLISEMNHNKLRSLAEDI